jgi:hypothetical protein
MSVRDTSIGGGTVRVGGTVREQTLRGEVRQSLSLILMTAVTAAAVLGLGLLGAHLLG